MGACYLLAVRVFQRVVGCWFFPCVLGVASACRGGPPEPASPSTMPEALRTEQPRYRPPLDESARRLIDAIRDGGVVSAPDAVTRLDVPAPPSVDVVAVRIGARWVAAAVERDRVTAGLAGAERIYNLLNETRQPPTAQQLARIIGALYYYPWRIYDGSSWTQTGDPTPPPEPVAPPRFVHLPEGRGRTLLFYYCIPAGTPGAGIHLANFHVTDSGYILDDAPHPTRR